MALTIENATLGYDSNGIEKAIRDINGNYIEKVCSDLNRNLDNLKTTIDQIWVGTSASIFKSNMDKDVSSVCAALRESVSILETDLRNAGAYLREVDENLIKPR